MTRAAPHCVAHDAFDVEALARVSTPAGLDALGARGSALLPDCAALLADAFFLFYKAHPRLEAVEALPGSARLNRRLLAEAMAARGFEAARARTLLDEAAAATAARGLVESILNLIRRHDLLLEDELLDAHRLKVAEELVQTTEAQFEALAELKAAHEADPTLPPLDDELIEALAESLDDELAAREGVQALATLRVQRAVDTLPRDLMARLRANIDALPDRLVALDADVEGFARSTGAGGRLDAAQRLALGEQLARSEKLRKLAALVGAFRSMARVQRERKVPRRGPEVYAVTLGNDPARLLASELSALRHPLLRADVRRRFLEGRLLQYGLRDRDDRGRGPMVICLDGSGSMQGPRELWAKAVTLTLVEQARRHGRFARSSSARRRIRCSSASWSPRAPGRVDAGPRRSRRWSSLPSISPVAALIFARRSKRRWPRCARAGFGGAISSSSPTAKRNWEPRFSTSLPPRRSVLVFGYMACWSTAGRRAPRRWSGSPTRSIGSAT
ncbi:MAG: hypothetical protein KC620_22445 [Myxococcales bacterium]|nr:hypothetical protein [Myxococcales bacterium]